MSQHRAMPRWVWGALATVAALAILGGYWGAWRVGFVGDDYYFLHASRSLSDVAASFTGDWFWHDVEFVGARYYRPLQITLVYLEHNWLFGEWAVGYHITNLLIHWLAVLLVGALFWQLSALTTSEQIPRLIALTGLILWFALHPRHAEAVCMINGRTDSFCAIFYMMALLFYIRWREGMGHLILCFSLIAYAAALLSKEMAITLPAILVIYELARYYSLPQEQQGRSPWAKMSFVLPHFVLMMLLFGVLRTWALGGQVFGEGSYITQQHSDIRLYFYSISKLIVANALPFDGLMQIISDAFRWFGGMIRGEGGALGVALYIALLIPLFRWIIRRGDVMISVGLALWIVAALPILGQLADIPSKVGDRYLYIPSIGAAIIVAELLLRAWLRTNAWKVLAGVLLAAWLAASVFQLRHDVHEWQIAGAEAQAIRAQLEALDQERMWEESFVILAMPGFYNDKTIQNTALGTYLSRQKELRGEGGRDIHPLLCLTLLDSPEYVSTETDLSAFGLTHSVEGGRLRSAYPFAAEEIALDTETFYMNAERANFYLEPIRRRVLLLAYDRGRLQPVHRKQGDVMTAQGPGGETWVYRYRMVEGKAGLPEELRAQVGEVVPRLGHDPWRAVHLSTGDVTGDGWSDFITSFGPTDNPESQYPGMVIAYRLRGYEVIGHPFTPFPRESDNILANPYGEVRTAVGNFIPGEATPQLACVTGHGGQQVIRLYQYTGEPMPNGWKIAAQVRSFDEELLPFNAFGGVTLSAGDLTGNGYHELVVGQTPSPTSTSLIQVISFSAKDEDGLAWEAYRSPAHSAFETPYRQGGGVVHAVGDLNGNGIQEILIGTMGSYQFEEESSMPSYISIIHPVIDQGVVVDFENNLGILKIFTPDENPSGALNVDCGNLDFDNSDEVVVGTGFSVPLLTMDQIDWKREYWPEPRLKACKLHFSPEGELIGHSPLPTAPESEWPPFAITPGPRCVSIDVAIINE